MDPERFAELVEQAVEAIPEYFRERIANVSLEVLPFAPAELSRQMKRHPLSLLGVYQGIPYKRRGPWYGNVMPDRILIFQRPIENQCRTEAEVRSLVRKVVIHEVGHYFGLSDAELLKLQAEADARDVRTERTKGQE